MLLHWSEPALDAQQKICAAVRLLMNCSVRAAAQRWCKRTTLYCSNVSSHQIGAAVR